MLKISKFTNIIKGDSYLLHNAMVNSVLKVNKSNLKEYIDVIANNDESFLIDENNEFQQTLLSMNMIVKDDEDEIATLNSMYFAFEHHSELSVMLIVTRKCNFECAYCYEEYTNDNMSQTVFDDTAKFILNQIEMKNFKNVYISFFGGEPTLMAKEINNFMSDLLHRNNGLPKPANIIAVMTTNGYLLTPDMIDTFVSNKIVRYQITVDGMEAEHNASRYLPGKKGTWRRIIENIKHFNEVEDESVSVLIRTRVCLKNPAFVHFNQITMEATQANPAKVHAILS